MLEIKKRYVVDEEDRRVAVQIDLETFAKIEEVLEDHALARWISEAQRSTGSSLEEPVLRRLVASGFYRLKGSRPTAITPRESPSGI